uniref:Uncharacterized protein n=1 Tax=Strigamia maritima TaxID=126957 RepID=T1J1A8_STRMM
MLEGMEMFNNLIFDIIEDGLHKNPKAYEMLKEPFKEIKKNIKVNMKTIHTFAIETSFWTIKNMAEYGEAMWSLHGKAILTGKFDHERAYHGIKKFLRDTEEFFAVQGLGLKPRIHVHNNLD